MISSSLIVNCDALLYCHYASSKELRDYYLISLHLQLQIATPSIFPLVNETAELLVYDISDNMNNVPVIDLLRAGYYFISLSDNVSVTTIEGEGTEDSLYQHVCGIECCHVNSTYCPVLGMDA
eukprot:404251_1